MDQTQIKAKRRLLHGGDYNPEQWLDRPDLLGKDLEYFKEAGINEVTLGVFSWSVLEPEEGVYRLDWLTEIIDRMYENGISVILATPSGARPKWLADAYPEVLRMDDSRRRALFGGRHNHCYTSPVYREKVQKIDRELSRRFGRHPAVIMWHISNEFGGECHCPLCQEAFRVWLKEKYGAIEKLNECWCTTFWSHIYRNFDEIESPSSIGESMLHALNLDWKRFVTDRTADFMRWELQALREAGSDKPVTVNLMYDYKGLNYHKFSDVVDVISWDNYPLWHKGPEINTALDTGFQHDYMRSLKQKPFLLMESSPSSTNWQSVSKLKKPGMLHAASIQAIAHGSDSVLYFQLRQSRGASEKFHGAVIDHYGGMDTRVFEEVKKVGSTLEILAETANSVTRSQAAIIYDTENRWAMEDSQGPRNKGLHYEEQVKACYSALKSQGINVDLIDMEQELTGYKIVMAPMLYLFRADIAGKMERFVNNGGNLVMTYWSGVVDEYDRCFLGETPAGLEKVLGLRREEIDGLYDEETNHAVPVPDNEAGLFGRYECKYLCELVKLQGAVPLAVYEEDFYCGYPAATVHDYGKGKAYYVCAHMGSDFYKQLLSKITDDLSVKGPLKEAPEGVMVQVRESDAAEYIFIQNYGHEAVAVELQPEEGQDECIYGDIHEKLGEYETVVVKRKK